MQYSKFQFHATIAITGTFIAAAYILFGSPLSSDIGKKKKKTKKGSIPGLDNFGNTCFLNAILQAMSSCSSFGKWMEDNYSDSYNLLNALRLLTKVLNNSSNEYPDTGMVLLALKKHGWVISREEQDAHELFHVITSTLDEELEPVKTASHSLLDISWLDNHSVVRDEEQEHDSASSIISCDRRGVKDVEENLASLRGKVMHSNKENLHYGGVRSMNLQEVCKMRLQRYNPVCRVLNRVNSSHSDGSYIASSKGSLLTKNSIPFRGFLANRLQCMQCGFKNSNQWSTFESISLSLPQPSYIHKQIKTTIYLRELLSAFIKPECVSEVTCDGCSKKLGKNIKTSFTKQTSIGKLPTCLCIHVQRTSWLDNGHPLKRQDRVSFPEVLDMSPFVYSTVNKKRKKVARSLCGGSTMGDFHTENSIKCDAGISKHSLSGVKDEPAMPCFESRKQNLEELMSDNFVPSMLYQLKSVIVHMGDVFSGHFVTYRRGPTSSNLGKKWFYTSDSVVREVWAEEVFKASIYMAMYEKL